MRQDLIQLYFTFRDLSNNQINILSNHTFANLTKLSTL